MISTSTTPTLRLGPILSQAHRPHIPFLIVQHSLAQSHLPILRACLSAPKTNSKCTILLCLLYPPGEFIGTNPHDASAWHIIDWTERVAGYSSEWHDPRQTLLDAVNTAPTGSLTVMIDSPLTLADDLGSVSSTYLYLKDLFVKITQRPNSRLILPMPASPLLSSLLSSSFSPSLVHLNVHNPLILRHIASNYLTLPPPLSPASKFWNLFVPICQRGEGEKLALNGEGVSHPPTGGSAVVEIAIRTGGTRKGVERVLEGFQLRQRPCALDDIPELAEIFTNSKRGAVPQDAAVDPTFNLPFNLSLTESQQSARAQVPLPYVHQGTAPENAVLKGGEIFYDADSGDDLDDEDPDEDLDL